MKKAKNEKKKWTGIIISCTVLLGLLLLPTSAAFAQNVNISGKVLDADTQEGIPGVNVYVDGTQTGTVTNIDGDYQIAVPSEDAVLVFSSVGYQVQKIPAAGKTKIDLSLEAETTYLDEIVVIGYGSVKRKDMMGAVSSVDAEQLTKVPVSSALEAMSGRMAGVYVTKTEGNPDAQVNIRVRGGGSITGDNSPLFIVDGFPVNDINDISPSDIESIDVLKDASSTAIYGSRGAYGVVIVTTKGGDKTDKIKVSFNSFYAFKKIAKTLDVLSPEDYVKYQYELAALRDDDDPSGDEINKRYIPCFGSYEDIDQYSGLVGNDWQSQIFGRTGTAFNNNLNIRGGTEKMNFFFSYANVNDKAIMIGSDFKRNNLNLKLQSKPVKNISLDFSVRYSLTEINGGGSNSFEDKGSTLDGRLKQAVLYSPIPITGMTSDFDEEQDASNLIRPITAVNDNNKTRDKKRWNANAAFTWQILKDLRFKTELGLDDYRRNDNRFYGLTTYYVRNNTGDFLNMPATVESNNYRRSIRNTNTLYYDFKSFLPEDHHLNLLGGVERLITQSSNIENEVWGLPMFFDSEMAFNFMASGSASVISHFYNPDDKLLSFFGRVNYDYKSKYLLSSTFRADGSSKFSKENQWGYFPSVSVAWRLSSEEFLQDIAWLNNLKVRLSYGSAGNNKIPSGQISKTFSASTTPRLNQTTTYWSAGRIMNNPDLKWETTTTRNVGLDFGFLRNRLNGSLELYQNNTTDLLMGVRVTGSGYDSQYRNMGETENKGIELILNYAAIQKADYGLSFSFNIGLNRNKIVSMGVLENIGEASRWASTEIGVDYWVAKNGSLGDLYGYRSDGRYEVDDFEGYDDEANIWVLKDGVPNLSSTILGHNVRPGDIKLKDLDGQDGVTADDSEILGNTSPKHTGGFSISGYLKGFDLSANFNWVYGNKIYNANKVDFTSSRKYSYRNLTSEMADGTRWTNLLSDGTICNDPETLVQMNENTTMWSPHIEKAILTDWAVEDGSFLRLSTLSVGYTIPNKITAKYKISSLRFYVTGYNVFCLTNYTGFDPEVDTRRSSPLTPNVDYSAYPKSRQIVYGVNLKF
jgi:TonB-dependent starch-binding outer membrane protein SusC